jgi:hypothetical protein
MQHREVRGILGLEQRPGGGDPLHLAGDGRADDRLGVVRLARGGAGERRPEPQHEARDRSGRLPPDAPGGCSGQPAGQFFSIRVRDPPRLS